MMRRAIPAALLAVTIGHAASAQTPRPFQEARYERIARRILVHYCYGEYRNGGVTQGSDCGCFVNTLINSLSLDQIAAVAEEMPPPSELRLAAKRRCGVPGE